MRRFSLEKWLNEPFFEDAVVGAAARVAVRSSYMMAVVAGVVERPPGVYKCAPPAGARGGRAKARQRQIELGSKQCPHQQTRALGAMALLHVLGTRQLWYTISPEMVYGAANTQGQHSSP